MSNPSSASLPPTQTYALLSFPSPNTLLVTFNRPLSLNCVNVASSWELDALFTWFDNEPSLRVAIVTGSGRAFCAGADLKGRFIVSLLESEVLTGMIGIACATRNALKRF
jgi:enoyl-CoA hydratase/carnithine racemase